jgi:hypothetical protein
MNMGWRKYKSECITAVLLLAMVALTIIYGGVLEEGGLSIRRWHWENFLIVLPVFPLLLLQQEASLPAVQTVFKEHRAWLKTLGVGIVFGLLDVVIIKMILHPEPYTELPPFLQPFPYSLPLYGSGALEIELYYRMLPLTTFLLLDKWLFGQRYRRWIIIVLAVITSLIEPIMQFPEGAWWFVLYATLSGIAMNLWQFISYVRFGFLGSLWVRFGHYLVWHISLGLYVQYFELA